MTSVRPTTPDRVDTHSVAAPDCWTRLSLESSRSPTGGLDGAWWPRSTDSVTELVALIEAAEAQRAPVRRVPLIMAGWDCAPRRIRLASGRRVAVDSFRDGDVRRIRIVGTDYQRLGLFAIPVDTTHAIAPQAFTMATDGQDPRITLTVGEYPALRARRRSLNSSISPTPDRKDRRYDYGRQDQDPSAAARSAT